MFAALFRNIAISAVAYAAVSGVALLLAPILIAAFGLTGFGQIVIARLFIPNAALGIVDFGTSEIATQIVARARRDDDWEEASATLSVLAAATLAMGISAGLALALAAPYIPAWMSVVAAQRAGLTTVLMVTAMLMPLLFASLLFEGILKGLEDFKAQRGCEVLAALSYGTAAIACVRMDLGIDAVCYALLLSLVIRLAFAGTVALKRLGRERRRLRRWSTAHRTFVVGWARIMAVNKLLGALQTQAAPPIIGFLFGPAAIGAVDALSRLPRFVKAVLGLLNSTVLPLAVRLEAGADHVQVKRLGGMGLVVIGMIVFAPLSAAMALSEPIVRLWLGRELAPHWPWQALLFVVPIANTLSGFGGAILLARAQAAMAMNRIVLYQVALQLALGLALSPWLAEWGFVLSQVVAVLLTFFFQMRLIRREIGFGRDVVHQLVVGIVATGAVATAFALVASQICTVPVLLAALVACALIGWAAVALLVPAPAQRKALGQLAWRKLMAAIAVADRTLRP